MNFELQNFQLTIFLTGRIDSSNAEAIGAEADALRAANPHDRLVFDIEALEYLSSAGLRMILKVRKAEPSLRIAGASAEVYEIFEMTGFTEMIPVEKAYRRLSVEGCEVIGTGANGKVYRLDPDTIIKVYLNPDSLPDIHRERELARRAFVLGVPTAIPYDVVKVGEGYGSVFELLSAKSLSKLIQAEPEKLPEYMQVFVELLKKIHATVVRPEDMPDQKAVGLGWADFLKDHLPQEQYEKLHALIAALPENHHMLHGDYHTKNVMMQGGEALLIDMDTLCQGDPVFEFASIYLAYVGFGETDPEIIRQFMGIDPALTRQMWEMTLRLYFDSQDEAVIRAAEDRARIVGYTRLLRRTIRRGYIGSTGKEIGPEIIENCKQLLSELLPRVDSLSFTDFNE